MALIVYPTIVGGLSTIGVLILPYVHTINIAIGNMINSFTELQPVLMCMLISMVFSFIIISPLSTVAIAIAIGITGLAQVHFNWYFTTEAFYLLAQVK